LKKHKNVVTNWDALPVVLTLSDVSLIFDVTEVTVKHWLYSGKLQGVKMGNKWFFQKAYIISLFDLDQAA